MIALLFLFILSVKSQIVGDVIISTTSSSKLYKPFNYRNPMVRTSNMSPVTLKYSYSVSNKEQNIEFDIDNMILEGIMYNSNFKEAILRDKVSGEMYIVRYSKIYTVNRKIVPNCRAEIAGKGIILYDNKKNKKKELILNGGK